MENLLSEVLEEEVTEQDFQKKLEEYETWDSVAVLSIIALLDQYCHVTKSAQDIKKCVCVQDIVDLFGK